MFAIAGSTDNNEALRSAIEQSNMTFVCAAGNNHLNLDKTPVYPGCFDLDNIINVACINDDYGLSYFSNYSSVYADIAAKGKNIVSAAPGGGELTMSGSSMSAAFVSAAAAKVSSEENILYRVKNSADFIPVLQKAVNGGNVLNVDNIISHTIGTELDIETPQVEFEEYNISSPSESWRLFNNLENIQVAAGYTSSYVLKSDGSVWAWGDNTYGQLGIGSNESFCYPVKITGISNVSKIYAGTYTAYAIKTDGSLWSWGANYYGGIGDGTTTNRNIPTRVIGISNVIGVAGFFHTIACTSDGNVWTWGSNSYGESGNGTNISHSMPVQLISLNGIIKVDAGYSYCAALKGDGSVYGWGSNMYYQTGLGNSANQLTPAQIQGFSNICRIFAHGSCSAVKKEDGTVYSFGKNLYGELGDSYSNKTVPTLTEAFENAIDISPHTNHTVFFKFFRKSIYIRMQF